MVPEGIAEENGINGSSYKPEYQFLKFHNIWKYKNYV